MADSPADERRRRRRYFVTKTVRTSAEERRHDGAVKDISGGGVAIQPAAEFEAGTEVEIEIEDMGTFPARVTRIDDDEDLFAVAFEIHEDEEEELVTEITRIHDGIRDEEH